MGRIRSVLWSLLLVGVSVMTKPAYAQTPDEIARQIPGVILLSSALGQSGDQLVPLGSVKEGRDGRATPERSERVSGQAQKSLYQLPSEIGLDEVKATLESLWVARHPESRLLYRCSGRECGQSNLWANDVFNESLLFGNDRTQFAYVYLSVDGRQLGLLYGSERPNRRSHFVVMSVALDAPWQLEAPTPVAEPADRWQLSIPRTVKGTVDAKRLPILLNSVTSALAKHPTQHWAVIAHECEALAAPDAFVRSQQLLDAVLPFLQKVSGKQFHSINAGNALASPCNTARNLEIIELQP